MSKMSKNKKSTISVNTASFLMKQLPSESSKLDESNELINIDFGSSNHEIITIELLAEIIIQ